MEIMLFCVMSLSVAGVTWFHKWATMLDSWEKPIFWHKSPAIFGYLIFRWLLYLTMYYMAYRLIGLPGTASSMVCQFFLGRVLLKHYYKNRLLEWIEVYKGISAKNNEDLSDPAVQGRNLDLAIEATKNAVYNRSQTPWQELLG